MDYSPVERDALVDLLVHGDNIPANIADNIGAHPKSVSRSLSSLLDQGLVSDKGRGVYTLSESGQDAAQDLLREREGD